MIDRIKQIIQRLLSAPSANEKHTIIIVLASLLALTLWFLVTLNQEYDASIKFPVKFTNIPQTVQIRMESAPEVDLVVKGGGVDLMVEYMKFGRDTLEFEFNESYLSNNFIPTSVYRDELSQKFPFEVRGVTPGRLYFDFENKIYKRVPLHSHTDFQLAPAFYLENEPLLSPDSVTILGPQGKLDSISEWYTAKVQTRLIEKVEEVEILVVDSIPGLTVTPKTVKAMVRPRKYTQADIKIPITVFDVPKGSKIRLEKDSLNLSCLVPMEEYESILEESKTFRASVSFYDLDPSIAHIIPQPKLPESIKLVTQDPFRVNFVIVNE